MKLPKFLGGGDDRERAATQYKGRESASASASRANRRGHRNSGGAKAFRQGQAWEDADRGQDRKGGWYRAR